MIKAVENNVVSAKKIRDEMGLDESLITWLSRKLRRGAPYDLKKIGGRRTFRVEPVRNEDKQLRGKGLVPRLKWITFTATSIFTMIGFYGMKLKPNLREKPSG